MPYHWLASAQRRDVPLGHDGAMSGFSLVHVHFIAVDRTSEGLMSLCASPVKCM